MYDIACIIISEQGKLTIRFAPDQPAARVILKPGQNTIGIQLFEGPAKSIVPEVGNFGVNRVGDARLGSVRIIGLGGDIGNVGAWSV